MKHPEEGAECECMTCHRRYVIKSANKSKWEYSTHCSLICSNASAMDHRAFWDYSPAIGSVFDYLLHSARRIYEHILWQVAQDGPTMPVYWPVYWVGWSYTEVNPYQFAGAFLDHTERMVFTSAQELVDYATRLYALTNGIYRENRFGHQ